MKRFELSAEAREVERLLGTMRPAGVGIDRDALMYAAGRGGAGKKGACGGCGQRL